MKISFNESLTTGFINNFIHSFWEYENTGETISNHTVFPDGYFSLFVIYTDGKLKRIVLQGINTEYTNFTIPRSGVIFGIHFKLLAAGYVVKFAYT